jgi:hypothetical protein
MISGKYVPLVHITKITEYKHGYFLLSQERFKFKYTGPKERYSDPVIAKQGVIRKYQPLHFASISDKQKHETRPDH